MRFSVPRIDSKLYHLAFVLGFCSFLCGCPKVEGKKLDLSGGVQATDMDKVKEYLKKAEIPGEIFRIEEEKDFWRVEVQAPPGEGAKRREAVLGMKTYRVDKAGGKVTYEGVTGG